MWVVLSLSAEGLGYGLLSLGWDYANSPRVSGVGTRTGPYTAGSWVSSLHSRR